MSRGLGTALIVLGLVLVLLGGLAWAGVLGWFGRLPGDIRIGRGATRVYIPIVSMLIVSLLISLAAYLFRR
ncbi:MAG TPA: DUF2905 domain-containing protein [Gemmatimonadaceae bacterium]|nr:DUF2905 domain-containing protein [Gemmatimonadaceae bacterium]